MAREEEAGMGPTRRRCATKTNVEFVRREDKFAACFFLKHPAFRLKIRSRAKGLRLRGEQLAGKGRKRTLSRPPKTTKTDLYARALINSS